VVDNIHSDQEVLYRIQVNNTSNNGRFENGQAFQTVRKGQSIERRERRKVLPLDVALEIWRLGTCLEVESILLGLGIV
jgi:hypothetical protein